MTRLSEPIEWGSTDADGVEHGQIKVPMDYQNAGGEQITIAVSRIRAKAPERRRGILLGVSGGPGGDGGLGIRLPERLADTPLSDVYDLIGFDPRGTGLSSALFIEITPTQAPFDSRPPDSAFALMAEDMRTRELGCQRAGGELRRHITTRNTARDMDSIRAALGEEQLSFIGYAYGTYVAAVYGTMFPDRLDRSVLDSCVHPGWTWRQQFVSQAKAVGANVQAWAEWTAARHASLRLGITPSRVVEKVEHLAQVLEQKPYSVATRTTFDGIVGALAVQRPAWERLAVLVEDLRTATCAGDLEEVGSLLTRHSTGGWGSRAKQQFAQSVLEVVTLETEWPTDLEVYYADMRRCRAEYPYAHGVLRAAPWVGTFRTFESLEPPTTVDRDGYPEGLIVQADSDPMDDYEGGLAMARLLGHRLVTVIDSGEHEVYRLSGSNPQLEALVENYLVDGLLPEGDVVLSSPRMAPPVPADVERVAV